MKKITVIPIIILLLISYIPLNLFSKTKLDILFYYESLPNSLFKKYYSIEKYNINLKNNKWQTKSLANYEMDVIVDINNGYIQIDDRGTGGGGRTIEIVLYRNKNNDPIIVINETIMDSIFYTSCVKIFKLNDKDWNDITSNVLPKIEIDNFLKTNYNIKQVNDFKTGIKKLKKENFIIYNFPRYGLKAISKLVFVSENYIFDHIFKYYIEFPNYSTMYKNFIENVKYEDIYLSWDELNSKFDLNGGKEINKK